MKHNYKRLTDLLNECKVLGIYATYSVRTDEIHQTYISGLEDNSKYLPHHQEHKNLARACERIEEFLEGSYVMHKQILEEKITSSKKHTKVLENKLAHHSMAYFRD